MRRAPVHLTGLWSKTFEQIIRGQEDAMRLKERGYDRCKETVALEEIGRTRDFHGRLNGSVLTKDCQYGQKV